MEVFANCIDCLMIDSDATKMAGSPAFLIGTLLVISRGLLRWSCYRYLGKMFTYEVPVQEKHYLVTSGPYSVVRHPSYREYRWTFNMDPG